MLIARSHSGISQHGGGSGRSRGGSQNAPDIRETRRLAHRLHSAHIRGPTVGGQPGVVGLGLQQLGRAAGTKKTEAHTLESGGESASQVGLKATTIRICGSVTV